MSGSNNLPRHDFYQTDAHVIISLYIKGYGAPAVKDQVKVAYEAGKVIIGLPPLSDEVKDEEIVLSPLYGAINPEQSSSRILSSKIELKLAKADATTWSSVIGDPLRANAAAGPSRPVQTAPAPASVPAAKKERRNWDKVVDEELEGDKTNSADPNAGGDAALKDFFSKLYKDADDDTRRAMIKSFTESGGTTLSTNWSEIGKAKTPIHPPEGMEARQY